MPFKPKIIPKSPRRTELEQKFPKRKKPEAKLRMVLEEIRLAGKQNEKPNTIQAKQERRTIRVIAGEKTSLKRATGKYYNATPHIFARALVGTKGTMDIIISEKTGSVESQDLFSAYSRLMKNGINSNPNLGEKEKEDHLKKISAMQKMAEIRREIPSSEQGKGIGTQMLKKAERIAKQQGIGFVFARTRLENTSAIKSYETIGWKRLFDFVGNTYYGKFLR